MKKTYICSESDCNNKGYVRGLCPIHYQRKRKNNEIIIKRQNHDPINPLNQG